jgi:hypothetical protein
MYGISRRRAGLVSVGAFVVYPLLGAVSAYLAAA